MPLPEDTTLESRCRIDGLLTFGGMSAVYRALGARCIGVPWRASEGMPAPTHTDRLLRQGKALVKAIEALSTIEPSGWFERWQVRLLVAAYKHRLREIIKVVPSWMAEEILSASEHVGEDRAAG